MFEVGKTYKTRDGRDAFLINKCVSYNPPYFHGSIILGRGSSSYRSWHRDGRVRFGTAADDLMPPEEKEKEMVNLSKPYQCRNGWEAEVLAINMSSLYPWLGRIKRPEKGWEIASWKADGRYLRTGGECPSILDLVNVPAKTCRWLNVYKRGGVSCPPTGYRSRKDADISCAGLTNRVGVVRVEVSEDGRVEAFVEEV